MEWNPKGSKYFTTVAIAFSVNSQLFSLFLEIKGNLINYILCYFGINLTEELHMHACMLMFLEYKDLEPYIHTCTCCL